MDNDKGLLKLPDSFGKESSWKALKKVLKNYFKTKKGINGNFLEQVMWSNDKPGQAGAEYTAEHELLVAMTLLKGLAYEVDNRRSGWS